MKMGVHCEKQMHTALEQVGPLGHQGAKAQPLHEWVDDGEALPQTAALAWPPAPWHAPDCSRQQEKTAGS